VPEVVLRWLDPSGALKSGGIDTLGSSADAAWVWVDVLAPDTQTVTQLRDSFDLHPLAAEDVEHTQARAKLDIYPSGLFMVWLTPEQRSGDGVVTRELDMFIGAKYFVTLHDERNAAIDIVAGQAQRTMASGPDWALHAIIDLLVDSSLPIVDAIGDELAAIEDSMLDANPRIEDLRQLHQVRRQLVRMHKIFAPERDVLHGLARERDIVSEESYRYFLDVGDHVARVLDSVETYQDVGASVMDVYLSAQNNRMNEIMKQLTVVATIFMPLTLLSGIYGMNVVLGMWPPINRVWSFWAVIGLMLTIGASMALYFRRKNWW
jgi:magnesium transporter